MSYKLTKKVMELEVYLQHLLNTDKYVGRNSRTQRVFDQCDAIWKLIEAQGRRLKGLDYPSTKEVPMSPYGQMVKPSEPKQQGVPLK